MERWKQAAIGGAAVLTGAGGILGGLALASSPSPRQNVMIVQPADATAPTSDPTATTLDPTVTTTTAAPAPVAATPTTAAAPVDTTPTTAAPAPVDTTPTTAAPAPVDAAPTTAAPATTVPPVTTTSTVPMTEQQWWAQEQACQEGKSACPPPYQG